MRKRVGILFNQDKPAAKKLVTQLQRWFRAHHADSIALPSTTPTIPMLDIALALGGDGTMLALSRVLAPKEIPVLGVNLGSMGFLTETNRRELYTILADVLNDSYTIEKRMMLSVTITHGEKVIRELALNDCTIHSGSNGRITTLSTDINNTFVTDYHGDGLIVATPTGSTAYSLAAGGPIVEPSLSVIILSPICPHALSQRPMIVPGSRTISIKIPQSSHNEKLVLYADGQIRHTLEIGSVITLYAAKKPLKVIVHPQQDYFSILRTKLNWGSRGKAPKR